MRYLLSFSFYIQPSSEWVTWICLFALEPIPSAVQEYLRKPIVRMPPFLTCTHLCVWAWVCVIEPGTIRRLAFVCRYYKCSFLGRASFVFACWSRFVGGVFLVCVCAFCQKCLSVCQAGCLKWILVEIYSLFQKEFKIISLRQCLELACVYICVWECVWCEIFHVHSICYVVCNCLCCTIHHRVFFCPFSSVTNLFSLLQKKKTYFKMAVTSFFFFLLFCFPFSLYCILNESMHEKLFRKRFFFFFFCRGCGVG